MRFDVEPAAVGRRRGRHGDDQLHVGHDGAPEGRAAHPPQPLDQRHHVRLAPRRRRPRRLPAHAAAVPLQRLGDAVRGHRDGRRRTWCCARSTAPRSCAASTRHGVTLMCGAPAVRQHGARRRRRRGTGAIPGAGRTRIVVAGAPPPTRTIERIETELGWEFVQIYGLTETSPLLTINRARAEFDELTPAERAVTAQPRRRAGDRLRRSASATTARCSPAATW